MPTKSKLHAQINDLDRDLAPKIEKLDTRMTEVENALVNLAVNVTKIEELLVMFAQLMSKQLKYEEIFKELKNTNKKLEDN